MTDYSQTLQNICENNSRINTDAVKNVLLVYEEKRFFIGDTCIIFDNLKYIRSFFKHAALHFNFLHSHHLGMYEALLQNNPHFEKIGSSNWEEIPFETYDLVICVTYEEQALLAFLHTRYGDAFAAKQLDLAVVSFSESILAKVENSTFVFPEYPALFTYCNNKTLPCELYITPAERQWGDAWLEQKGITTGDALFIIPDSSTNRGKVLNINVYFTLLSYILQQPNTRVLIFDERNMGKKAFYSEWLSAAEMEKIIFSEALAFREDLCILSSRYVRVILGPCTGLMHCASGAYNRFVQNGMSEKEVPLMIVYTSTYGGSIKNANYWWGNAPYIHCIILKKRNFNKVLLLLHDMPMEERNLNDELGCSEYTAEMLISFLRGKWHPAIAATAAT